MAFNRKNWQDNVSDITAAELNRIEQGIYDNSLVVDAVTNKLNPTDTETYKTAELTEGQITDVIGVNDILIKGQTSQNGEPTPDSPVDVNVVSGSNVINTSNKNLANMTKLFGNSSYYSINHGQLSVIANDGRTWDNLGNDWGIELLAGTYMLSTSKGTTTQVQIQGKNSGQITRGAMTNGTKSFTLQQADIIGIKFLSISTYPKEIGTVQIEQGSTATTYEQHQGKELPLDLPVENLINLSDGTNTTKNVTRVIQNGEIILNGTPSDTGYNNQIFIYTAKQTGEYMLLPFKSEINPNIRLIYKVNEENFKSDDDYPLINLSKNDILTVILRITSTDPIVNFTMKPMLYIGSKANAYTPYGTDPIELCKIGDYQDYFYKSGSKWYLHKEINKKVLNGSENWQLANSGTSNYYYYYNLGHTTIQSSSIASTHYPYAFISNSNTEQGILVLADGNIRIRYGTEDTVANFKTWLATNNVSVYYPLATATSTEITDTTLISQLEAIYNAPLYEQTNITQINNDLPMVLDITACKDNINGIKAFIRK